MSETRASFDVIVSEEELRRERAKARELRASQWWKRRRAAGVCHYCGKKVPASALTMDHIVPIIRGGKSTKGNVVAACKECNNKKKHGLAWEGEREEPKTFLNGRVAVKVGDITRENVDAVVNAANSTLLGGGGVDGAIHRAGGPEIKKACEEIRRMRYPEGLPTGQVVLTTAGNMPARYVIHTVGPVYSQSKDKSPQLAACYTNSLSVGAENAVKTIAFPAISTGIYGYPREAAAEVVSTAIEKFLQQDEKIEEVRLVFFQAADAEIFIRHQRFSS